VTGLGGIPLLEPYLACASLVLARCSGTLLLAPIFSAETIPLRIRGAFALLLTLVLSAHLGPVLSERSALALAFAAVGELLVGLVIGLLFRFVLLVVEMAGELAGLQMGFAFAQLVDPLTQESSDVTAQLLGALTVLLLLAADGHRWIIAALAASFRTVPLATSLSRLGSISEVVPLFGAVIATALRLAAPVVVALLMCNVALALLARAAPQLSLFFLGFGISIGVGLIVLGVLATSGMALVLEDLERVPGRLAALLGG
jgi:flagellar biosynthetic protein FliR